MGREEELAEKRGPEGESPRWIRDGARAFAAELVLFARTALAFTLRPYRSARDWSTGRLRAANPLAFLATSAAIVQPVRTLAGRALGFPSDDSSLAAQVLTALGPFAHYAAVGWLCHVFLRASTRARPAAGSASDAVGLALFAGGGPAAAAEILFWAALVAASRSIGLSGGLAFAGLGTAFSIFCASFAPALGAAYRAGPVRVFLAFVFAFVGTGLVFGLLHPPGYYGMHWVVELGLLGGARSIAVRVTL